VPLQVQPIYKGKRGEATFECTPASSSAKDMTCDDNGNLLSVANGCGTTTYDWDGRNRLAGIRKSQDLNPDISLSVLANISSREVLSESMMISGFSGSS
jgi:YD repeat-containing protein